MSEDQMVNHVSAALSLILFLSLPPIVVAAVVGIVVGFFQALTQIQEQTLSFGLKLAAVTVTLFVIAGWLGGALHSFALNIFENFAILTR
jgi:type III secretion protein S